MNHHKLEPSLYIGKAGITNNIVKQVQAQLRKKKVIKVKFLPTAIKSNRKELMHELAKKAHAKLTHQVGFTAVLEKVK